MNHSVRDKDYDRVDGDVKRERNCGIDSKTSFCKG